MRRTCAVAVAAFAACLSWPALAVHKCQGKDGSVLYQDTPCPGTKLPPSPPPAPAAVSSGQAAAVYTGNVRTVEGFTGSPAAPEPRQVEPNTALQGPPQAHALVSIYRRWIDAERLALATPRVGLAGPVGMLQGLQREAEAVRVSGCLAAPRTSLILITSRTAEVMLSFMSNASTSGLVTLTYRLERPALLTGFEQGISDARC